MKKILFIINTCYRHKQICYLLKRINALSGGYDITINLYNDGSPSWMNGHIHKAIKSCEEIKVNYKQYQTPHGKEKYWELVTDNFSDVAKMDVFDYYFMIPDDAILPDNYINEAIRQFDLIDNDKKICLNLFTDLTRKGQMNWGAVPVLHEYQGTKIWNAGWVDMEFIAKKTFFSELQYKVEPISPDRWSRNPLLGSGVGHQISDRLRSKGWQLFQVDDSLSYQVDHESIMNYHRDFTIIPIKNMKSDKVIVNIASMKSRKESLKQTIQSLLDNTIKPDTINVYLNDYQGVPEYLQNNPVIQVYFHPAGDLADNAKFYCLKGSKGYYFTCDDDLVYPKDYIERVIAQIEFSMRKCVVGAHGILFTKTPIADYYVDRTVKHCLGEVRISSYVHILGTGCLAFHTDTLSVEMTDFKTKKMADIWFALKAQQQEVPMYCISHSYGWIKQTEHDQKDAIWNEYKNDNKKQCELVNSVTWKVNVPDFYHEEFVVESEKIVDKLTAA